MPYPNKLSKNKQKLIPLEYNNQHKFANTSIKNISNLYNEHEKANKLNFNSINKLCKLFDCTARDLIEHIPLIKEQ